MSNPENAPILPENTKAAIEKMMLITQEAITAFQEETNAVAVGADLEFYEFSKTKIDINQLYKMAADEFMSRKEELIGSGDRRLSELAELQKKLGNEAMVNMQMLDPIRKKA